MSVMVNSDRVILNSNGKRSSDRDLNPKDPKKRKVDLKVQQLKAEIGVLSEEVAAQEIKNSLQDDKIQEIRKMNEELTKTLMLVKIQLNQLSQQKSISPVSSSRQTPGDSQVGSTSHEPIEIHTPCYLPGRHGFQLIMSKKLEPTLNVTAKNYFSIEVDSNYKITKIVILKDGNFLSTITLQNLFSLLRNPVDFEQGLFFFRGVKLELSELEKQNFRVIDCLKQNATRQSSPPQVSSTSHEPIEIYAPTCSSGSYGLWLKNRKTLLLTSNPTLKDYFSIEVDSNNKIIKIVIPKEGNFTSNIKFRGLFSLLGGDNKIDFEQGLFIFKGEEFKIKDLNLNFVVNDFVSVTKLALTCPPIKSVHRDLDVRVEY